jgi:hypothetical protein
MNTSATQPTPQASNFHGALLVFAAIMFGFILTSCWMVD